MRAPRRAPASLPRGDGARPAGVGRRAPRGHPGAHVGVGFGPHARLPRRRTCCPGCVRLARPAGPLFLPPAPRAGAGVSVGSFLAAAMLAMMTTRLLFVPLELDDVRGYATTKIGLLLAPAAGATAVALFIGGRAADRVGRRLLWRGPSCRSCRTSCWRADARHAGCAAAGQPALPRLRHGPVHEHGDGHDPVAGADGAHAPGGDVAPRSSCSPVERCRRRCSPLCSGPASAAPSRRRTSRTPTRCCTSSSAAWRSWPF